MKHIKAAAKASQTRRLKMLAGGAAHSDEPEDRMLVKKMVKSKALTGKAKGGAAKGKKGQRTQVNVVVAPRGGERPVPVPVPVRGVAPAAPVAPSRGPEPLPIVAAKKGGAVKRASGGRVHMTAGAATGEGRLQKSEIQAAKRK